MVKLACYIHKSYHIDLIEGYVKGVKNVGIACDCFQSLEELISVIKKKEYDLIYLFTESEALDDVTSIQKIRRENQNTTVMLISGSQHQQFMYYQGKYIGGFNRTPVVLNYHDIYMMESCNRLTYIHTESECMRIAGNLKNQSQKLPKSHFIRVNQGSVVNMRYIKTVTSDDKLVMENGKVIYITRSHKRIFYKEYKKFAMEHYGFCLL